MSHKLRLALAAIAFLGWTSTGHAAFINFDDVVGSDGYTSPTNVSTRYAALGVTFFDPDEPSGAVKHFGPTNVFVANQHQTTDAGDLRLNFSVPVNTVTFDFAGFFDPASLHALAYNSSNVLLGTFDFALGPVTATIDTGVNDISYLLLAAHPASGPNPFENFHIDNLSFGVSAVPEPSTWAMMMLGFCGIGAMLYRNKRNGLRLRRA
jgi:hypothetical protein